MKELLVKGMTSKSLDIFIQDSSSSIGAGLAGLVHNSAGLVASYHRPGAARTAIALVTQTVTGAYSSGGFVEIDATNMPGMYRLDVPDTMIATGVDSVTAMLKGATNMAPLPMELQLVDATYSGAYAGPRGPGIYFNDLASNTNTVPGKDGTFKTPVSTEAAAKTLADLLGVDRIYLVNDSMFTVAAIMEDYEFVGLGEMTYNTVALGNQNVDHSYFENVVITGAQGGTARIQAKGCVLSAITNMEISALGCVVADGSALVLRNDCMFEGCWSAVSGLTTPTLNINAVANVNVYFRHYSGGITITNAVATTVMSWEGIGQFIVDATCISLSIVPRGVLTYTDNGTTTNLLTDDAAINLTNINTNIVQAGSAVAVPAKNSPDGFVITSGENEVNNEDTTHELNGVTHDIEAVLDTIQKLEVYYEFDVGPDGITTDVQVHHYLDKGGGASKNLTIWAWDWIASAWKQVGTLTSGSSLQTNTYKLFTSHVGTGANIGLVRIRYLTGSVALSATTKLLVDQIFVEYALAPSGIVNGSTVTLGASTTNTNLIGHQWTLILGTQVISGTYFSGCKGVSGIGTGTDPKFEDCVIDTVTLPPSRFLRCQFSATMTFGAAGAYRFLDCSSGVAGSGSPIFDFGAFGATTVEYRDWKDSITLNNLAAGDVVTLNGRLGTVTLNGTGATVEIRGTYKNIAGTMAGEGGVNLGGAIKGEDVATINAKVANLYEGIKRNVAFPNIPFDMVLASDHVTPATGLTVTGQRSIDGGAYTAVAGSIVEVGSGGYSFDALAADTNGGTVDYKFSAATADDTKVSIVTTP